MIFLNFFTFFATLTPKTSGYVFSSTLSSNTKLFLASDAPNNRNIVAKFENVENLSVAPISQLSYKVKITVIFSPRPQPRRVYIRTLKFITVRSCVRAFVCASALYLQKYN